MKKIFLYLMFAAVTFGLQSCLHDDEELFEDSAAERIDKAVANAKSVLKSAPNGWHLEYYLGSEYSYGGYNFIVKFTEDRVYAAGEIAGDNKMVTWSSYDVVKDQGPVLTVNTYNEILHFLTQPYSNQVDGFEGDFEFVLLDVTPDRIELKGKKWGNHMILTRMDENVTWESYLDGITNIKDNILFIYEGNIDGKPVYSELDDDNHMLLTDEEETEEVYEPFIYTSKGLRLREPVEFSGVQIQNFTYDVDHFVLTCDEHPGLQLTAVLPEGYQFYDEVNSAIVGDFTFSYYFGLRNVNVTITENADKNGWVMTGLVPKADIQIKYNKQTGAAYIYAQQLGTDSKGSAIFLAMWDLGGGGNLTWSTDASVKLVPSQRGFSIVNGGTYAGLSPDSFILWDSTNSGQCSDAAWLISGSAQMLYLVGLNRK